MFIKNIKLQNYRNYDRLNGNDGLDFGKKATLLIGKNGAGKLEIEFYSSDDLEALLKNICGSSIFSDL